VAENDFVGIFHCDRWGITVIIYIYIRKECKLCLRIVTRVINLSLIY